MRRYNRRSIRLKDFDYSQPGAYFVTVCTYRREHLFGKLVDGEMRLNRFGRIVWEEWMRSADIRPEIILDEFVVMPNHVHGIIVITESKSTDNHQNLVGAHGRAPLRRKPRSLSSFLAGWKSATAKRINQIRGTPGGAVLQRNFYDHIVRNERSLNRTREYIHPVR